MGSLMQGKRDLFQPLGFDIGTVDLKRNSKQVSVFIGKFRVIEIKVFHVCEKGGST